MRSIAIATGENCIMLAGRRRFLYRLKALLCAALILNINYWAGCGASSFDAAQAIRINLTPDHPLTLELNNTAFGGAIALEIDPSSNQFRLIYPEPDRIIQGGYGEGRDGLALTNLATSRRGKNTSMEFNPKTKQVTRVISARGDQWQPEKVLSARELPVGLTGVDAYVAANPELMSLVVDPTKVDEVLSLSGKDNSAQLVIDPTVILLAFLFQFCPGCLGYLLLFTIFQIIADVIFNYLSQQPNDGDDGDGGSQPLPTPAPPIARPDAATTPEDTPVTIDVLANDEDADFGLAVSSVRIVLAPANGTTSVNALTGAITYTPNTDFNGPEAFAYEVCDAGAVPLCATTVVSVTVTPLNDPPMAFNDVGATFEDDPPLSLPFAALLANDTDVDLPTGDMLAISNVTDSFLGAVVTIVGTNVIYDHSGLFQNLSAGANTTDLFTYTMQDLAGATSIATVTVNITGRNDDPIAVDDEFAVDADSPATIQPASFFLANDTDIDADDVLTVVSIDAASATGAVSFESNEITYDPGENFLELGAGQNATDTFTYTIDDGNGGQDTAVVTVTVNGVNDPPVAMDDEGQATEDGDPVTLFGPDLLANDFDIDIGDSIAISNVTDSAASAVVSIVGDDVIYNHTGLFQELAAGANTTDTFTYTIEDLAGLTASATVTMTVIGVNDPPVAEDDMVEVLKDAPPLVIPIVTIFSNDSDIDIGDTFFIANVTDSMAGAVVSIVGDDVIYDFTGLFNDLGDEESTTDTFTYTIEDTFGAQGTATVTVTVNGSNDEPIVAKPSVINVDEDSQDNPLNIAAPTDPDAGDMLTITVTGLPDAMLGTVTLADGTPVMVTDVLSEADLTGLLFDAALDASGPAGDFAYDVTDGLATVGSTVTINVAAVADAPNLTVMDTSGLTNEAIALDITASLVDTDGSETLSITVDNVPLDATLSAGTDNGSGSWTLAPGDLAGLTLTAMTADTIMLSVTATATETSNNDMASTMDTLTVTVEAENNPPLVDEPSVLNVDEDSQDNPLNIAAPTDPDVGDMLTITVTGLPDAMLGTVTLADGTPVMVTDVLSEADLTGLLFDAALDASGAAGDFAYDVTDGLATVGSTVTINVAAVADAPNLTVMDTSGLTNEAIALDITASLVDTDGSETLSITIDNVPLDATLSAGTDNGSGSWTLAPGDLAGLTLTAMTADTIMLSVTATATETSNNDMASTMDTLTVTVTMQALTLFTEGNDTVDFNTLVAGQFSKTEYYDALGGDDMVTLPDIGAGPSDFDKSITFFGGDGNDTIQGGNRADMIEGGNDNDMLFGGPGADTLTGGPGDDLAAGGLGPDFFFAGTGNDTYMSDSRMTGGFFTENGSDAFDGEDDVDVLQLSGGGWTVMVMGVGTLTPGDFIGGSYTQAGAAFGGMVMVTLSGSADPTQDGVHGIQFVNIEEIRLVDGSLK
ncbi:hypothetical protein B7486_02245 [cyanobacterium TDX16]|nr:hypothetical protein B7486_02245 [cyanobacterium TDX16]